MCGLNDFKRASPWRTPAAFRHDLRELIAQIHASCGSETTIVLPALPVRREAAEALLPQRRRPVDPFPPWTRPSRRAGLPSHTLCAPLGTCGRAPLVGSLV